MKLDLYRKYGVLAAAGDRHLAEFMPNLWYLKDPETVKEWQFGLTTVDFRENQQAERIAESIEMAEGRKSFSVVKSTEEAVDLMKPLPVTVANLVYRNCANIDATYEGIKERDLGKLYVAFANQPLCNTLTMEQSKEMFKEMCFNTREYLDEFFPLNKFFN